MLGSSAEGVDDELTTKEVRFRSDAGVVRRGAARRDAVQRGVRARALAQHWLEGLRVGATCVC